jgi:exopolysaccharide biosynthesis polyprenyl glycosylphosphotransferase
MTGRLGYGSTHRLLDVLGPLALPSPTVIGVEAASAAQRVLSLATDESSVDAVWGGPRSGTSGDPQLATPEADGQSFIELSGDGSVARPSISVAYAEGRHRRIRRGWLVRRLLLAGDILGLLTAFVATELLLGNQPTDAAIFVAVIPAWVVAAKLSGLYDHDDERAGHSTTDEFANVFGLVTLGVWLFYASSWILGATSPSQPKLATFWLFAIATVTASRAAARAIARRQTAYLQNTIILGAGDVGQLIGRKLLQHPEYGINLIGFVDSEPRERREDLGDLQLLGGPNDVEEIVRQNDVERVIIAFSNDPHDDLLNVVHRLRQHNLQIDVVPRLFEAVNPKVGIHTVEGLPLLSLPPSRIFRSSRLCKRCLDLVGASVLVALTAPLMGVIAVLIRRDSPGPIFFRQTRLGMDMREFTLFKFRTMREGTDEEPHRAYIRGTMDSSALPASNNLYKLERSEAVTRIGRWLRITSLDELPQLLNVLRGDMSLVGPRPCIPYEIEFFAPQHFERFLVPAGLTGLWQVEARAHSTFGEALQFDVAYARGWSHGLDLRLLARTPFVAFRKLDTD